MACRARIVIGKRSPSRLPGGSWPSIRTASVAVKDLQSGERVAADYKLAQTLMPLTMRPTKLSSPVDKGRVDFTLYCGAWAVGRIYEHLEGPEHLRWFWALNGMFGRPREIRDHGHAPTFDEAKAQFEAAWQQWLEWAKLDER